MGCAAVWDMERGTDGLLVGGRLHRPRECEPSVPGVPEGMLTDGARMERTHGAHAWSSP